MPYLLAEHNRPILESFARSNVLLGLDYDGTLAPLAPTPARARMRTRTRRLLIAVARRYPCVIISGRSRRDLARRLAGVPVWEIMGNHGIEPQEETPELAAQVQAWVQRIAPRLAGQPGIVAEDKTFSVTIHYRQAPNPARARAAIARAVRGLDAARIMRAHGAVNLVGREAPHKGVALERARRLLRCDRAIYIGDDETDEDAFAWQPDRLLSVRIGAAPGSRARYRLRDQGEVDDVLRALVALRS